MYNISKKVKVFAGYGTPYGVHVIVLVSIAY